MSGNKICDPDKESRVLFSLLRQNFRIFNLEFLRSRCLIIETVRFGGSHGVAALLTKWRAACYTLLGGWQAAILADR